MLNVFYWYAFPFYFPSAHYAGAWIAIGGLVMHIGAKWEVARRALRAATAEPVPAPATGGLCRGSFLTVTGGHRGRDPGRHDLGEIDRPA